MWTPPRQRSGGELYGLKVEVSTASATPVGNQVIRPSSVMHRVEKQKGKGQGKKGDSKGWNDSKGWKVGTGWSDGKGWNTSGKGWEQQKQAGMNNLERDSKRYDVLMMETSTQEKTVRDGDWCVPVKHIAKLSRMRGSTSTKTNIKFFVDPEEEDRDNDTTSDCLGSKQFALKDDVSYKCSYVVESGAGETVIGDDIELVRETRADVEKTRNPWKQKFPESE